MSAASGATNISQSCTQRLGLIVMGSPRPARRIFVPSRVIDARIAALLRETVQLLEEGQKCWTAAAS
jgi:hypothetical protein